MIEGVLGIKVFTMMRKVVTRVWDALETVAWLTVLVLVGSTLLWLLWLLKKLFNYEVRSTSEFCADVLQESQPTPREKG